MRLKEAPLLGLKMGGARAPGGGAGSGRSDVVVLTWSRQH